MILFVQAINVIRFRSQVVSLLYVVEQIFCSQSLCCASLGLSHIHVVQSEPESCMVSYPELGNHFSNSLLWDTLLLSIPQRAPFLVPLPRKMELLWEF